VTGAREQSRKIHSTLVNHGLLEELRGMPNATVPVERGVADYARL
jgi:hypothetical protein